MGQLLEEIINEIIQVFQIQSVDNFETKKRIGKGFSGAEVYLVELKNNSAYNGIYFLKIDTNEDEYLKAEHGFCFSNVASVVKSAIIHDYYVMLLQIAGQSLLEYTPFYEIEELSQREKAIKAIIPHILEEATRDVKYISDEMQAGLLFGGQLGGKLSPDSVLEKFVRSLTGKDKADTTTGFCFEKELYVPNAYAYAVNDALWENKKVRNTKCFIHGDFHGNNIFFSNIREKYALIDLALYRDDGYVFYDTSYFELSLLLFDFEQMKLIEWIDLVQRIASKDWGNVDCKNKEVIIDLQVAEDDWITNETSEFKSYKDGLLEARMIARVIAGLNFAGKKKVNLEIRRKSFLYACIYLQRLLEIKKIMDWQNNITQWNEIETGVKGDEIRKLSANMENFSDTQRYILVLGDQYDYTPLVYEALSRIYWSGMVSFKRTEDFESILKKYYVVNEVTDKAQLGLITPENFWCLYADGVNFNPDTIKDTFPRWRNKYGPFFDLWANRLDGVIAPDELQILVDLNSFSQSYIDRLERLCVSLDLIENTNVTISILASEETRDWNVEGEYDKIICKKYSTSLYSLADFCVKFLHGIQEEEVTIPSIHNLRKPVPLEDYKFIKTYVFLLHNKIIQDEGYVDDATKREFYYGKEILWQSIEDRLYVEREEYEDFYRQVENEVEKENNQFLIRIVHSPGAGASVLCRVLCWRFRNLYPVVLAKKMNKNIIECIHKLYSLSGKHILLFADGDFSENDIAQLQQQSRHRGIKVGIIFPYRSYDKYSEKALSILTVEDALKFSGEYSRQMKLLKEYTGGIMEQRSKNMSQLATNRSLMKYRLPFFFGINAFEDDYINITDYLQGILAQINNDEKIKKAVNYIALITYYTEEDGLNIGYVRKILGAPKKESSRQLQETLNGTINNCVYYANGVYKICHSVVALEILSSQYKMSSNEYEEFLENFVRDICACEGKEKISDRLNDLLMNLFIKRDIEGDVTDNLKKKNFSPIVLSLDNSNLQEKFFAFLAAQIPQNAHFKQHYGRLIIYNNPDRLEDAKEQFDAAIEIEPNNPIHYHARGNMYTKYVMNMCRNKYREEKASELFDRVSEMTESAISDYEISISEIQSCTDITIDISYPYASIIQTITYVVHQLYLREDITKSEREFLNFNTEMSKWCKQFVQKAEQYDMDTEVRYDGIRENEFYKKTRSYLTKYKYSQNELEKKMQKQPENLDLMRDYLYSVNTNKELWGKKTQRDLEWIMICCMKIIRNSNIRNDGMLWRWFNAAVNYKKTNIVDMISFLETRDDAKESLTIQFMLYVIKTGKYFHSLDDRTLIEILDHIEQCRKLNQNSDRVSTRYYYNGQGKLGFCHDKEDGVYLEGVVTRWVSAQNGRLSLKVEPKFSAFFVPHVINMREEGAVGTKVRFKLGVSFDGFRAWDPKVI